MTIEQIIKQLVAKYGPGILIILRYQDVQSQKEKALLN